MTQSVKNIMSIGNMDNITKFVAVALTAVTFVAGAATSRGALIVTGSAVGHGGRRATNGTMTPALADNGVTDGRPQASRARAILGR